jgi:hypothetical protein
MAAGYVSFMLFLALFLCSCSAANFHGNGTEAKAVDQSSAAAAENDGVAREIPPGGEAEDSRRECRSFRRSAAQMVTITDGAAVTGSTGNLELKGRRLALIKNFRGNLVFLGTAEGAKIEKIESTTANILVCYADVGEIGSSNIGNIVLVGGKVGSVGAFEGNLISVDDDSL